MTEHSDAVTNGFVEEEEEEEATVTASEYLQGLDDDEQEVDLVLGADDGDECTYSHGSLPRQAVFACLTCCPRADQMAGFCTACSLHCHDGHEVVELWTKRNFRCDCGNSKFANHCCSLQPAKEAVNSANKYGQNFRGLYCSCKQPYPDPAKAAAGVEETMLQCSVCEDWFHQEHLNLPPDAAVPDPGEYADMICSSCVENRCSFLLSPAYAALRVPPQLPNETSNDATKEEKPLPPVTVPAPPTPPAAPGLFAPSLDATAGAPLKVDEKEEHKGTIGKAGPGMGGASAANGAVPGEPVKCKLDAGEAGDAAGREVPFGASLFFREGWRTQLCTCAKCQRLLADAGVLFLLDPSDTLAEYFAAGKRKRASQPSIEERAQQAFLGDASMSHVQKVEMIHGFNHMKEQLMGFLKNYDGSGKAVTADAVRSFFGELRDKRRRIE
eukprot:TRINITY_DN23158_c0_g1_i1.p1 TRINITY_DN23158_c0_g1~~TRINITY_DN23158_c0_g1_i1.p1  ORF type:complete len:441 (-),score=99.05 TRINITY_DN23158_c0_g1_i1:1194-2516(-)